MTSPSFRRLPDLEARPRAARLCAALAAISLGGWALGAGCGVGTSAEGAGGGGGDLGIGGDGVGGIDWEGSTGSGDDEINADLEEEDDTYDPSKPECGPESVIDEEGVCTASCTEAGGYCADADPSECDGWPAIPANDCGTCCEIPEEELDCSPEGCEDPVDEEDCPPGEDCSYTATCPDGVCDVDEDCSTCPIDCGPCEPECGDLVCDAGEACGACPHDCGECEPGCGDGFCDAGETPTDGETCESCPMDCGRCLKVMTWSIDAGLKKGKKKVKKTLKAIANVIKNEKPDLVGLEGVDKKTKRSGGIDEALFIAKRAKMYKRFAGAFQFQGGQYGVALLSKYPVSLAWKTILPTSGEWAKRRTMLNALVELEQYAASFRFSVAQIARSAKARMSQAKLIGNDLLLEPDAVLVGDLFAGPNDEAIVFLQEDASSFNLLDGWPDYKTPGQKGLTTAKKRADYVMPATNWRSFETGDAATCPALVRMYVKPAKGLSSHRPVVALFQVSGDCGGYEDGGLLPEEIDDIELAPGDDVCTSDADCAGEIFPYCLDGYCEGECKTDAECTDPEFPKCIDMYCEEIF